MSWIPPAHVVTGGFLTPDKISKKIFMMPLFDSFIARLVGEFNTMVPTQKVNEYNFSATPKLSNPINMYDGFENTNRMLIPQVRNIGGGYSAKGDGSPVGHEKISTRRFTELVTRTVLKSYQSSIGPENDRLAKNAAMENEAEQVLKDWWTYQFTWEVIWALVEGYSSQLTSTDAQGGLNSLSKRWHPNIYVAGSGYVTDSETLITHRTNIVNALVGEANITGLYNNGADPAANEVLSADLLTKLKTTLRRKHVKPTALIDGKPWYLASFHDDAVYQLKQDQAIKDAISSAYTGKARDHPSLSGADVYYDGYAIVSSIDSAPEIHAFANVGDHDTDVLMVGPVTGSEGTLAQDRDGDSAVQHLYYAQNSPEAKENALKVGIIWGEQALNVAVSKAPTLETTVGERHPHPTFVDWLCDFGIMRCDFVDKARTHGATPTNATEHYGSVLVVTNSPPPSV